LTFEDFQLGMTLDSMNRSREFVMAAPVKPFYIMGGGAHA
jgi:hypothetical protein